MLEFGGGYHALEVFCMLCRRQLSLFLIANDKIVLN